ncbi:LPXTG cell wall anchor domain-containing protein [Bacteroidota bacterium]
MKTKAFIAGLFFISALMFSPQFVAGQDDESGTFIEEQGDKQDSTKKASIFDFEGELDEQSSSSTGLIIIVVAVVLVVGGTFYLVRKKKKATG